MSIQYLQNNKVNYLAKSNNKNINFNNTLSFTDRDIFFNSSLAYQVFTPQSNSVIVSATIPSSTRLIFYNFGLAYSCSNFTQIADDDYAIITVATEGTVNTHKYHLNKHFLNTFQAMSYIHCTNCTTFTITLYSSIELSYYPVKVMYNDQHSENAATCKIITIF